MTSGDEDIEEGEGLQKFLDTRKGGSEKIVGLGGGLRKFVYFKTNRRGWLLKIKTTSERALLKFQALSFNIFIPPCHIRELVMFNLYCICNVQLIIHMDLRNKNVNYYYYYYHYHYHYH